MVILLAKNKKNFSLVFFVDGVYTEFSHYHFGEFEQKTNRNTASIKWSFYLDGGKICRVVKTTSKGDQIYWEDSNDYKLGLLKKELRSLTRESKSLLKEIKERSAAFHENKYIGIEELYYSNQRIAKQNLREINSKINKLNLEVLNLMNS